MPLDSSPIISNSFAMTLLFPYLVFFAISSIAFITFLSAEMVYLSFVLGLFIVIFHSSIFIILTRYTWYINISIVCFYCYRLCLHNLHVIHVIRIIKIAEETCIYLLSVLTQLNIVNLIKNDMTHTSLLVFTIYWLNFTFRPPPLNFSLNLVDLVILAFLDGDYFYK